MATVIGDDVSAPCPTCKRGMSMHYINAHDHLRAGFSSECPHCGERFVVDAVERATRVWLSSVDEAELVT